jgi:hypothetical protein
METAWCANPQAGTGENSPILRAVSEAGALERSKKIHMNKKLSSGFAVNVRVISTRRASVFPSMIG